MEVWRNGGSGRDFRFFRVPISTLRMKRIALFSRKTGKTQRVFATDACGHGRTKMISHRARREHRDILFSSGGRYRQKKTGSALRAERPGTTT